MDRKEFIKTCGFACLGAVGLTSILQSCKTAKSVNATAVNDALEVVRSDFKNEKNGGFFESMLLVNTTEPGNIVLYRHSETEFTALLMVCTHQGVALSDNGSLLTCSAHGSEFDRNGNVITGPADQNLKKYRVTSDDKKIYVHLK